MNENERDKLVDLTSKAIEVNKELLADEQRFIVAVPTASESSLHEMNEHSNDLCSQEHLLLAASKSLLQMVTNKS